MGESSVETVRLLFERVNDGGIEAAIGLIAEDFVAEVPPSMSAEPDVYRGHDGVRRYFAGFEGLIDDVRFEPIEIVDAGDDAVIVWLRFGGRGATSGIDVSQFAAVAHRLRDGKVTWMAAHPDMDAARAAIAG
jgi:ketosteroid isomerase-like protein